MKKTLFTSTLFAALFALPVLADEGRRHISGPRTITEAGTYIVTRSFSSATNPVILIAADDVTLDLNGQLISSPVATNDLIGIQVGKTRITIKNGRLSGGKRQIVHQTSGTAALRIHLESIEATGSGQESILIQGLAYAEVISCTVLNPFNDAFALVGAFPAYTFGGRIIGNRAESGAPTQSNFVILGLSDGEVRGNHCFNGPFLQIGNIGNNQAVGRNIVEDNMVFKPNVNPNFSGFSVDSSYNIIRNNIVSSSNQHGIGIAGNGNLVFGNIASKNGLDGFHVVLSGSTNYNRIEGNQVTDNGGCGIAFYDPIVGNAYRDNMLRNNTGGAVCGATGRATDEGGNIP